MTKLIDLVKQMKANDSIEILCVEHENNIIIRFSRENKHYIKERLSYQLCLTQYGLLNTPDECLLTLMEDVINKVRNNKSLH